MARAKKGMGFKAAAKSVAKKQRIPMKQANAVIAAGARNASAAAKKKNPNLKKVASKRQRSAVASKRQRARGTY